MDECHHHRLTKDCPYCKPTAMTDREIAERREVHHIASEIVSHMPDDLPDDAYFDQIKRIEAALTAAVEREREACAKVASDFPKNRYGPGGYSSHTAIMATAISLAISARGEKP